MKKRLLALMMAATMAAGLIGCGGGGAAGTVGNVELQELEGFSAEYTPDTESITQQSGRVDVVIVFDGTESGWEALAEEYERIHGTDNVDVRLDTSYVGTGDYQTKLQNEVQGNTEWDIVQGNLLGGNMMESFCVNMSSWLTENNPYAGAGKIWKDVLDEEAYLTDTTGANSTTYILNSENLQTAWFVNTVALEAAAAKGYKNADGKAENPITWDDMMLLCEKMVEAGYKSPLGIAMSADSIKSNQFAWLLRVYGDQYYRQEYANVFAVEGDEGYAENEYELDLTATNPEADTFFNISETRLYNAILDDSIVNATYVGAKSPKYAEFLEQFHKMRDYLLLDSANMTLEDMRNVFQTQSKGKESPQIMLDYAGSGLAFIASKAEGFAIDFYDYPAMVGEYVDPEAIVRDVGGNGGYLTCVRHEEAQNTLNKDFLMFVLSPYGQSIYYKALAETGSTVKGLTTVKNETVLVPDEWVEFFETDKIAFNGLVDVNRFVGNLVMYIGQDKVECQNTGVELWKYYLTGTKGKDAITTAEYQEQWHEALMKGWEKTCKDLGYAEECYMYPGKDTSYSE